MIVSGEAALQEFRESLTGRRILSLLTEETRCVRISLPVGIGKSVLLDKIVETAVVDGRYDLVVVLVPTRRILNERAWIQIPPDGVEIFNLRPRPMADCGSKRNIDGVAKTHQLLRCCNQLTTSTYVSTLHCLPIARLAFGAFCLAIQS